jgi:hypothetical protein
MMAMYRRVERLPYQIARAGFERSYVLELLERHGWNVQAAAREAEMPVDQLQALVHKYTRSFFIAKVNAFYGGKLADEDAARIADHLLELELAHGRAA